MTSSGGLANASGDDKQPFRPSAPLGTQQRHARHLPKGLRIGGLISAAAGILGAAGIVYLVTSSEEQFFGPAVDPSEEAGYYALAWVTAVACGAQIYALIVDDIPKIRVATILRIATIAIPMLVTPALEFAISIGVIPILHLLLNGAILAALSRSAHQASVDR